MLFSAYKHSVFLVHVLVRYVFLCCERYFVVVTANRFDLIFPLYLFHSASKLFHYLLLSLYHFFHLFFSLYQPYLYGIFQRSLRILFSYFTSLYYSCTIFTETFSIKKSSKASEIRNLTLFNLAFPSNYTLRSFFFFFVIFDLYFLISSNITHIFITAAELEIPTETPQIEANIERNKASTRWS